MLWNPAPCRRLSSTILMCVVALLFAKVGTSHAGTITKVTTHQINVDQQGQNVLGDKGNEPTIAVDPTYPSRIVVGWREHTVATDDARGAWSRSLNGGRDWAGFQVFSNIEFRSDPVVSVDALGRFYYMSLRVDGQQLPCELFRSLDGGGSWQNPVAAFDGDKPWVVVDRTGGPGQGNIYCTWLPTNTYVGNFIRSTDSGMSFDAPDSLTFPIAYGTMDVAANGSVFTAGVDVRFSFNIPIYVIRSSNAWDPNQNTTFQATQVDLGGEFRYPSGTVPNPSGLHSLIWVVVDPTTGPTPHVYALAATIPPGPDPSDVFFARSTDGGVTFDPPVRLNTDPQQAGNWQWLPVMSIAPNGRIDVVWHDTRASGVANLSELYYTCSSDGGLTWSVNQKVSNQWDSYLGWGSFASVGEYNQMVSDNVGADLAWTATFNGEMDVFHTRLGDYDCNQNGVGDSTDVANQTSTDLNSDGIPDECEQVPLSVEPEGAPPVVHSAFPNPFRTSTTVRFNVDDRNEVVRLRVFDIQGRELHRLVDGLLETGPQAIVWDGTNAAGERVASGVYFYLLEIDGIKSAAKVVLSR